MQTLSQNAGMEAIQFNCHDDSAPGSVTKAIRIIWTTLALSVLFTLYLKSNSQISAEYCTFSLLIHCLVCLIPYKLSGGSNPARFIYLTLVMIGAGAVFGGFDELSKSGIAGLLTILSLAIWASVLLLRKETNIWLNDLYRKPEFACLSHKNHLARWHIYKNAVLDK